MTKKRELKPEFQYKRGRIKKLASDERTYVALRELGRLKCTQREASAVLNCSENLLNRFLASDPLAMQHWQDGKAESNVTLRRKIWQAVEDGDLQTIRWLAKDSAWLSMDEGRDRERKHEDQRDERRLSAADRLARLVELAGKVSGPVDGGKLIAAPGGDDPAPGAQKKGAD